MSEQPGPPPPPKGNRPGNFGQTYGKRFLTSEQVDAMFAQCGGGPSGARDRALLVFLYRTGVERAEAVDLKLSDLNLTREQETATIRGIRQRKPRMLALDALVMSHMRPWLAVREEWPGDRVFCAFSKGSRGNRLKPKQLADWIARLANDAGVHLANKEGKPINVTPGTLRTTFAAELLATETWPLHYLQRQLGITTMATLQDLLEELGIHIPDEAEVAHFIRNRPPRPSLTAP
jgi:site-specific recombinase XerD